MLTKPSSSKRLGMNVLLFLVCLIFAEFCSAVQSKEPLVTTLPRVYISTIETIDSKSKTTATIRIESDDHTTFSGYCGIEYHGNSTLAAPKKSYDFELRTKLDEESTQRILDFGAEEDFILLSNTYDRTQLRNVFANVLWSEMGHYVPKYKYCELYLNDEYQGLYLLIEKIKVDRNRLNLTTNSNGEWDFLDPILLKFDGWSSDAKVFTDGLTRESIYSSIIYPKWGNIEWNQLEFIRDEFEKIDASLNAILTKDSTQPHYSEIIDVNSFVDYFLINEIGKNPDGFKTSGYMYRDHTLRTANQFSKFRMGPVWDFDLAFRNVNYGNHDRIEGWVFQRTGPRSNIALMPKWWHLLTCDPTFIDLCDKRLSELLESNFEQTSVKYITIMDRYLMQFKERDQNKWKDIVDSSHIPKLISANDSPQEFVTFFQQRIQWMKDNIRSIPCISPASVYYDMINESELIIENDDEFLRIDLPEGTLDTNDPGDYYEFTPHYSYIIRNENGQQIERKPVTSTSLKIPFKRRNPGTYYIEICEPGDVLRPAISAAFYVRPFYYKVIVKD